MTSLQDFITQNFKDGVVRFHAETHVTPEGIVKMRLITNKIGIFDELECLVLNNTLRVIENNYVENKSS